MSFLELERVGTVAVLRMNNGKNTQDVVFAQTLDSLLKDVEEDTKAKALVILRARLFAQMQAEEDAKRSADRKSQVGSGDRSERIRTYNFPQNRLSDHRINLTLYRLEQVMQGEMQEVVDALIAADRAAHLGDS